MADVLRWNMDNIFIYEYTPSSCYNAGVDHEGIGCSQSVTFVEDLDISLRTAHDGRD